AVHTRSVSVRRQSFISEKEKGSVFIEKRSAVPEMRRPYRSAHAHAELVEPQLVFAVLTVRTDRSQRVGRLQKIVLQKLEKGTMETAASALRRNVYLRETLILSRVGVVLKLELPDGFQGRRYHRRAEGLVIVGLPV